MRQIFAFAVAATFVAPPTVAQQPSRADSSRGYALREELQELVAFYERSAESPAYGEALRERARNRARRLERRLEDGDFQVGDRVLLRVTGEEALTDTFTVAAGQVLNLPELGAIPLRGVLRAELEQHLTRELGQFLREPRLVARSLMRIALSGGVASPGFYTVPSEALLSDALMVAGGPSPAAMLDEISVERGGATLWSGQILQTAIVDGLTLDQLGIVAGDRIVVPEAGGGLGGSEGAVRTLSYILSIPLTIYTLTQIF